MISIVSTYRITSETKICYRQTYLRSVIFVGPSFGIHHLQTQPRRKIDLEAVGGLNPSSIIRTHVRSYDIQQKSTINKLTSGRSSLWATELNNTSFTDAVDASRLVREEEDSFGGCGGFKSVVRTHVQSFDDTTIIDNQQTYLRFVPFKWRRHAATATNLRNSRLAARARDGRAIRRPGVAIGGHG